MPMKILAGVILASVLVIALAVLVLPEINANFTLEKSEKVKIGVMAPFSGPSAKFGEFVRQGIDIALEEMPAEEKNNFEFIYEDDQCNSREAITAAQKLIFVDKVKYVLGPLCNESVIPTEAIFEQNKVISLTTGQPNTKIAEMGSYHFAYLPEIKTSMRELAREAYLLGSKKIGIIYIEGDYGYENYYYFKKYFEENGGEVVDLEMISQANNDFPTLLVKIKEKKPDSILLAVYGANLVSLLQQMEKFGMNSLKRYSINAFETPLVIKEVPIFAEGIIYPAAKGKDQTNASIEYYKKFSEKYGAAPDIYSGNVRDYIKILSSSIKECGKNNCDCVLYKLASIKNYPGTNGTFSVDERGVGIYDSVMLRTVKDGKFVSFNSD